MRNSLIFATRISEYMSLKIQIKVLFSQQLKENNK